jgi:oxygen-independent coproporphyrinogen III oxidase
MTPPCTFPPQPAGLYFHIPFCLTKCSYCSFTSYPCPDRPPPGYPAAVVDQLILLASHPMVQPLTFGTIFFGGGTPTIYPAAELTTLLRKGLELLNFTGPLEISTEANPNTVNLVKLKALRQGGVNRLSIGVQSFSDSVLAAIGRSHTAAEAHGAIALARQAGFENLNLDLIYGLPGQSLQTWRTSLEAALTHEPEHLAIYELMVEENTPFAERAGRGDLILPAEEVVLAMEEETCRLLAGHGYRRYEISNFARPGYECRHNLNYWQNGSYLGLGAGAVSCLDSIRIRNVAEPKLFMNLTSSGEPPFAEAEVLPPGASFRETVIMGLRLLDGIAVTELKKRFGWTPAEYYGDTLARLHREGLVATENGCLRLTPQGLPLANQVLARLV